MASDCRLYYDVIFRILGYHRDDYGQLFRCSLVNKEFNRAASNMLYYRVVLSPPVSRLYQLNLRDTGAVTSPSNLPSATLPQYAELVVELEVSGFLNARPPPRNTLHTVLADALRKFTSIRSVKFIPATFHEDVFVDSLKLLPNFHTSLRELVLNASCTSDEEKVTILTDIKGLAKLALHSPGRAILQGLPGWLEKNASTLTELHLLDNCGSVTPGVLKSFLLPVGENLKAFSLGLSYSITDEDIFAFLSQLPNLEHLRLRNYWVRSLLGPHRISLSPSSQQMKPPTHKPGLGRLKTFIADYGGSLTTCKEVSRFCVWIRRTVAASPLQSLHIIAEGDETSSDVGDIDGFSNGPSDDARSSSSAYPAFDSLVEHLTRKHANTLKHLHMRSAFVSLQALQNLLERCLILENLNASAGATALDVFSKLVPVATSLHTASFEIKNIKPKHLKLDEDGVAVIMHHGAARLRRLSVNGRRWEIFELFRSAETGYDLSFSSFSHSSLRALGRLQGR
ncbi:hypothetical protein NMY22_g11980 [Coprinellus aureogranulatus]|nr:hypothetical protein NMY22_g11980 [Coprinellus aureogranulatus]